MIGYYLILGKLLELQYQTDLVMFIISQYLGQQLGFGQIHCAELPLRQITPYNLILPQQLLLCWIDYQTFINLIIRLLLEGYSILCSKWELTPRQQQMHQIIYYHLVDKAPEEQQMHMGNYQ